MLSAFVRAFRTPDLRRKLLFTIGIMVVFRIGSFLPTPGVSYPNVQICIGQTEEQNSLLGLVNLFSGGALLQLSVFALGIMPYITASIIIQLLRVVIPHFEALHKEGQSGTAKLTQYTRYLTIGLAVLQSTTVIITARNGQLFPGCSVDVIPDGSVMTTLLMIIVMTAGTGLIMWLGELITERGVGNGMSLLIFTSIAASFPGAMWSIAGGSGGHRRLPGDHGDHRAGHRARGLRRAVAAPHPGAVREAHGRPPHVRRVLDLHPDQDQHGRRHPGDLRVVAAAGARAARGLRRPDRGLEAVGGEQPRGHGRPRCTSRCTCC